MDLPPFSLEEMLTAIERRLPGGRVWSIAVLIALVVLLLVFTISKTFEILDPVFTFLWTFEWPSVPIGTFVVNALAALVPIGAVLGGGYVSYRWMSRFRTDVRTAAADVLRVGAIKALIEAKETAIKLLAVDVPDAPGGDPLAHWIGRVRAWEQSVDILLRQAGATGGQLSHLRSIATFTPLEPAANPDHARRKGVLAERERRLSELIRDLEKRG